MAWQAAPGMQPPEPTARKSRPGTQTTTQRVGGGFGSEIMHCAVAVVLTGTAGHGDESEHSGAQNLPGIP
jgi:hypothetical protein